MESGWNTYALLFLAALLSLALPFVLAVLSRVFRASAPPPVHVATGRPWAERNRKTNTRFFQALNAGICLFALALLLVPSVGVLRELSRSGERDLAFRGAIGVLLISIILVTGLLYAGRKGDLSWLRSFDRERNL